MGSEHSFVLFSLTIRRCNDKHSITIHLSLLSPLHVTILHNFPRLVFCKHARFRRRYFLPLLQSNSRSTPDSFSSLPLARTYTNSLWKERRGNREGTTKKRRRRRRDERTVLRCVHDDDSSRVSRRHPHARLHSI